MTEPRAYAGAEHGMSARQVCDICGRARDEIAQRDAQAPALQIEDGLLLCSDCRKRLTAYSKEDAPARELDAELERLIGRSAGAICMTMNLPYRPPYRAIIDAASKIAYDQDRYMSAWTLDSLWLDGTTVWRDEDGSSVAFVYVDGSVSIQSG